MKVIKWKSFVVSGLICLLPILLGLALWNDLPDTIAIHFNINNLPDNFASKPFAVFGIPVMMMLLQGICCVINDVNAYKHGERKKFEIATKSIIPVMSIVLQTVTLGYSIGWDIDMRRVAVLLVGAIFLVIGNYLPKFDYIKHYDVNTEKARKINRFIGFESVVMGILFLISVFLPPVFSLVCIVLLIPYALISIIYGIVVGRRK